MVYKGFYMDWERLGEVTTRFKSRTRDSYASLRDKHKLQTTTITSVLAGKGCSIESYLKFCNWLNVHPGTFIAHTDYLIEQKEVPCLIAAIRTDERIDPIVADAIATLLEAAYPKNEK